MVLNLDSIQEDLKQVDGTLEELIDKAVIVYFPEHIGHIYFEKSEVYRAGFLVEMVFDCSCGKTFSMDHDHLFGSPW